MNANEIFQNMIGSELEGLVVKYTPYNENFDVHPYRQSITTDFEKQFADLLFDSIIFYAFEKEEIEKDYIKGRFKEKHQGRHMRCVYLKRKKNVMGYLGN